MLELLQRRCLSLFFAGDCDGNSKPVKRNTAQNVDSKGEPAAAGQLKSVCRILD